MSNHHGCLRNFFRLFQKNMICKVKIDIVYFIKQHENVLENIKKQWTELVKTGIMDLATLHIVLSSSHQDHLLHELKQLFSRHRFVLHFTQSELSVYVLYQLAQKDPSSSHYILYFDDEGGGKLVSEWKKVLSHFRKNPSIHKIGLNPETKCWWIRASYLSEKMV